MRPDEAENWLSGARGDAAGGRKHMPNVERIILCRCEDTTLGEVRRAIALGARTFDDIKRVTRAGMGVCQARTCGVVVQELLATEAAGSALTPAARSVRPPVRPIALRVLEATEPDAPLLLEGP